jgi:SEC-C motif
MNKPGRNDPCPCGSGKKYKNCHMLQEKESSTAKYTAGGKRKFKAKVISIQEKSQSVFSRSATVLTPPTEPTALEKLKFKKTKTDFRAAGAEEKLPFPIPTSQETPQERERHLPAPGEEFKPTAEDFRKKKE